MLQTDLYSFSYKKGSVLQWCKRCGGEHFYRKGKDGRGLQRYQCRKCGFRFVWSSDLPKRHFFSNVISFAVELYGTVGISLRTVSHKLKKYFNINISHEGIRLWVLAAKNMGIIDDKTVPTRTWHIDETYIKIKGKGFWLWIVYCRESKHVIAWHISKDRLYKDAHTLFLKAMHATKGRRPDKIITDGLYQYDAAIYKVMGWNYKEHRQKHIRDSGIGLNAILERVNREVKRRTKWFSTFQSLQGANAFFGLWFYHYNQAKSPYLT